MLQGYTPIPLEHFGGLIASWPPEMLDCDLMAEATNVRYTQAAVSTRQGLTLAMKTPSGAAVRGLVDYVHLDGTEQPLVFDAQGHLYAETPAGSGTLAAVAGFAAPAGAWMNGAAAFNRAYLGFGSGLYGTSVPASFDGANFDPVVVDAPGGAPAAADAATEGNIVGGTRYGVVMFKTREGSLSKPGAPFAIAASGSLPVPTLTLTLLQYPTGFGTLPAPGVYYVVITWLSAVGESLPSAEQQIAVPTPPSGSTYHILISPGTAPAGATGFKYYVGTTSGGETLQGSTDYATGSVQFDTPPTTTGPAPPTVDTTGRELTVTDVPTGSAQVAARVLAFTVSGATDAGPYFYIEQAQQVGGVNETATVIDDNVTTTLTVNFDDAFLAASENASDQFRTGPLPSLQGVMFSQTTQRMMWWGDPDQPATVYCSQPGDAGNYLADTGFFQVEEGSGLAVTSVFEYRNQLYVALQRGLYLITPNDGDPATWSITHVSHHVGCCGPRALAVGTEFVFMIHESGAYVFDGTTPTMVSAELLGPSRTAPGAWEQINWAERALIWCAIDHDDKCVRVGVPTGGSAVCDTIYKVSYLDGWDPSLRFSPFTARYHYFPGRRWSRDTIAASQCAIVRRPMALPPIPADRRLAQQQVLLASSEPKSGVYVLDADSDSDDGRPIPWALQTGAFSASEILRQQRQGVETAGVVQIRASGAGPVAVALIADGKAPAGIGTLALPAAPASLTALGLVTGEAVSLRLSSGDPQQASRITLLAAYVFSKPVWTLRPDMATAGKGN